MVKTLKDIHMKEKYESPLLEEIKLCIEQSLLDNSDVERAVIISATDSGWGWN